MMLWADDNIAHLDLVWMILLWFKLTGIRTGPIFPSKKRLLKGDLHLGIDDEDAIEYPAYCTHFFNTCVAALGEIRNFQIHTPRPTAFCLSAFRGAGDASLMHDSRSKHEANVARYSRGSRSMLQLAITQETPGIDLLIDTFKSHRY